MNEKNYIVFYDDSVVGVNKKGWVTHNNLFKYWWVSDSDTDETWSETDVTLTREQVIDLLEFKTDLDGDNVYKFDFGVTNYAINKLRENTALTISELNNYSGYTNDALIKKIKCEGIGMSTKGDAVKRPSHYMLEDGTEVKNHIRSILGDEGFKSWAIGNAIKYVSRYKDKGKPIQDLKKAQENIQMVIDVLNNQESDDKLNKLDL